MNKAREQLAEMFLSCLQKERLPWNQPWVMDVPGFGAHHNPITGTRYWGMNAAMLWAMSLEHQYPDPRWCTFKQAQNKDWHIKKGEKGTPIEFWCIYDTRERHKLTLQEADEIVREDPDREEDMRPCSSVYVVFNGTQIDGIPELPQARHVAPEYTNVLLESFAGTYLSNEGITLIEGSSAVYNFTEDIIKMPPKRSFLSELDYYGAVDKVPSPTRPKNDIIKPGGEDMQLKYHMITIEDMVPAEHFLRKLEAKLNLSFVYEETAQLYSRKYGRPPIDPIIMVKYLLVGFLYGIPSERQIEQRIQTDVALRWYLGLDLFDRVPDHSTISQLRRRKPSFRKVFRRLFEEVVRQCVEKGLVSGRLVVTDSTHMKANASRASEYLVETQEEAGNYWERLDEYEEEGLEELAHRTGKRRGKRTKQVKKDKRRSHKRVSRTDPDAGHMKRPGKPEGPCYLVHETTDSDHGIILDAVVTGGDSSDSAPYLDQIERVHKSVIPIQAAAADSAYDFPLSHRVLEDLGVDFFVRPQSAYDRTKAEFKRDAFCYDATQDVYICPNGKSLRPTGLYRSGSGLFWEYWADKKDCGSCPLREKCLRPEDRRGARRLLDSYFKPSVRRNLSRYGEPEYREALKLRQIWCEGTFATQKVCHNLTRVLRRGLEAAEDHCLLSATALNLKRMIRCMR